MWTFTDDPVGDYHADCARRAEDQPEPEREPDPPYSFADDAAFRVLLDIWRRQHAEQNPVEEPF